MESRYRLTSKSVGKREVANRRVSAVWQGRRRLGAAGIRVTGEMQVSANTKARAAERKSQQAAGSQGQEGLARQREGGGLSSVACWRPEKPQDPGMRAGGGRPRLQACTFLQTAVPTRGSSSSSWVDVGQPGAPWKLADGSGFGFWAGGHSRNPLSDSLWQKLLEVPQPRPGWEQPRPPPVRHGQCLARAAAPRLEPGPPPEHNTPLLRVPRGSSGPLTKAWPQRWLNVLAKAVFRVHPAGFSLLCPG